MLETSARLLRLLSVLQARSYWSGQELSERLEVTARTLRRDIDRLRSLGYAVEATSGPGGGYRLGTGAAMPPLLLDDDEAVAVAVALRVATDAFVGLNDTVVSVLVKMRQLLPQRLRRRLGALEAVTVSITGRRSALHPDMLTTLAAACRDHERLRFAYRDHQGRSSTRTAEPHRLAHTGNQRWYLVAWDVDREDWRTFRVDRIGPRPTIGPRFIPRQLPEDVETYVSRSISDAPYSHRARLRLRGSAAALAERIPPWCGVLEAEDNDHCILSVGAGSLEALVCQMILTGAEFELLEPPGLVPHVRAISERLARALPR